MNDNNDATANDPTTTAATIDQDDDETTKSSSQQQQSDDNELTTLTSVEKPEYKSTVEQGTAFELKVTQILAAYGYDVQHNVIVKGKSGADHQIDVLAKHAGPLHNDSLVVECKAYGHNVEKDILMKQLNICADIGFGGIMIFTTAGFADGCHKTAEQYRHVTLIDGNRINSMTKGIKIKSTAKPMYVKPFISESKARKYAKSRAKKMSGGMFTKRPKVTVKSVRLVCYPYHTAKCQQNTVLCCASPQILVR